MFRQVIRYITRCTLLLLMPVIALLTGCKSDTSMDFAETAETAEDAEADQVYTENADDNNDTDLSTMEIYERFLNGELTVELKKEQVPISGLFWDNDIEYCFLDIDGDGGEELHIRDSAVYYAIKVCDGTPQIIFEGWWGYEPVVTDGLCGILLYDCGYGSEDIEFIKISADGSRENDGWFRWFDRNQNGNMDEEDSFHGGENIDMEQYVRYREEQTAKLAGNELEWTSRQLMNFSTWQEAYIDFIKKIHVTERADNDHEDYSLIYVDDDDIPELYFFTGYMAGGEFVVSFYDGNIGVINRGRVGLEYMEYGGLLYGMSGHMEFYPCNVYRLEKGKFSEIGTGWSSEEYDEQDNIYFYYFWEDSPVTEAEYEAHIEELIDTSKCVKPSVLYTKDEILKILAD